MKVQEFPGFNTCIKLGRTIRIPFAIKNVPGFLFKSPIKDDLANEVV